jgi:ADP-heptose:LPS heptosyltransferase
VPVLRGIRRTWPDAHVAWLLRGDCAGLVAHDTDLDEVVPFRRRRLGAWWRSAGAARELRDLLRRLRRARYDLVLDLQGLFRSGFFARVAGSPRRVGFRDAREGAPLMYTHKVDVDREQHTVARNIALARAAGIDARDEDLALQIAPRGRALARELQQADNLQPGGFVAAAPPTTWQSKSYPVRHWRRVVRELAGERPVVLLGSPSPRERALCAAVAEDQPPGVLDWSGRTSIEALVAVIADAAAVVCCDSAAKFIAQGTGTDVAVLTGPTRSNRTGPYPQASTPGRSLVAPVACAGCLRKRCTHRTCMESIAPSAVVSAVRAMLKGPAPRRR